VYVTIIGGKTAEKSKGTHKTLSHRILGEKRLKEGEKWDLPEAKNVPECRLSGSPEGGQIRGGRWGNFKEAKWKLSAKRKPLVWLGGRWATRKMISPDA